MSTLEQFKPVDLEELNEKITSGAQVERPKISLERKAIGREEYNRRVNDLTRGGVLQHTKAVSYRAFRVGTRALADLGEENGFEVTEGHNYKPRRLMQFQWDKLCAENNACTEAILDGAEYIHAIVVVSHHQKIGKDEHDASKNEKALHSCLNCRNLFRELIAQGIMGKSTMIRFVDDDSLVYEDPEDTETLIGGDDDKPVPIEVPKLKLKKPASEITEQDIENLPFEEMTMQEFLDLYKDDPPQIKGKHPAPYTLPSVN